MLRYLYTYKLNSHDKTDLLQEVLVFQWCTLKKEKTQEVRRERERDRNNLGFQDF